MTDTVGDAAWPDADVKAAIEKHPALDERGEVPYTWNVSTTPPTQVANTGWIPTYDLHAAAAAIWETKAAAAAQDYDFEADDARFARDQVHKHCMEQVRYHLSRRKAKTLRLQAWPPPDPSIEEQP